MFFFSSRRRHTRWTGDWSSDVCSSDLLLDLRIHPARIEETYYESKAEVEEIVRQAGEQAVFEANCGPFHKELRSEERRVGKECRSRRSPDHKKNNKKIDSNEHLRDN